MSIRANPFWRCAFFVNRNVVRGVGEGKSKRAPVRAYSAEGERRMGFCPQSFGELASRAFLCGRVRRAPGADSQSFPASVLKRTAHPFSYSLTTTHCRYHEKSCPVRHVLTFWAAYSHILAIHFLAQCFHFIVCEVLIILHLLVDQPVRRNLNHTVGNGLYELMVMRVKDDRAIEFH
ncbi:hypothetical protein DFP93_105131 [Aneurinibacillus soli]|uniref:Uncharacterized protein n=1 Tax=Aneurinibacillus soli TaxID=1500254 RepID=A0A0U4WJ87_9BACL|nr:hypothetical protein DFP93_105131 [Aneurinibacillus soli]BAU28635.1 hypothetical protein CB4_02810 [Aneurinibacillus soli]